MSKSVEFGIQFDATICPHTQQLFQTNAKTQYIAFLVLLGFCIKSTL